MTFLDDEIAAESPVKPGQLTFCQIVIGQAFSMRGVRYVKTAVSCAETDNGHGHLFLAWFPVDPLAPTA